MVVFYSIVLIIDMQLLNMLWYKMAPLMGRGPSTVSPNEDVDVAAERHRVNEMSGGTELDVVTLDGLTKVTISCAPDQFRKMMKLSKHRTTRSLHLSLSLAILQAPC